VFVTSFALRKWRETGGKGNKMNRNKNRFLTLIFSCFFGIFVIGNAWSDHTYGGITFTCGRGQASPDGTANGCNWNFSSGYQRPKGCYGAAACPNQQATGYQYMTCSNLFLTCKDDAVSSGGSQKDVALRQSGCTLYCEACRFGDYTGRYPVAYSNGSHKTCAECNQVTAGTYSSCGVSGLVCKYEYERVSANGGNAYDCVCTSSDRYTSLGSSCWKCPSNTVATCSNSGGFGNCLQSGYYKVQHKTSTDQYYGKYECRKCPYIDNYSTLSLSTDDPNSISGSWATSRCTRDAPEVTDQATGCRYTIRYQPDASCTNANSDGKYKYSTASLPDASTMTDSSSSYNRCDWKATKTFTYVPNGYRVVNGQCQPCPVGYFGIDRSCHPCPYYPGSSSDALSWSRGTTASTGSVGTQCYYDNGQTITHGTHGDYMNGVCYLNTNVSITYYLQNLQCQNFQYIYDQMTSIYCAGQDGQGYYDCSQRVQASIMQVAGLNGYPSYMYASDDGTSESEATILFMRRVMHFGDAQQAGCTWEFNMYAYD